MIISIPYLVLIFVLIFVVISTQTLWLQQKPKKDILTTKFSTHEDIWTKKEGNTSLMIMLHGMYSQPNIFDETAKKVSEHGWDVYAPVLPNSSESYEDLKSQEGYLWEDSLKVAFQRALIHNQGYQKIVLAGHSQGGALALTIAPSLPFLNGLISVAAPMNIIHNKNSFMRNLGIRLSGILVLLIPKKGMTLKSRFSEERKIVEGHSSPQEFHFGITLHSMHLGLKQTRKNLYHITTPCLFIHDKGDTIALFDDCVYAKNNISSASIKELFFDTPMSLDPYSKRHKLFNYIHTKEQVVQGISDFLKTL